MTPLVVNYEDFYCTQTTSFILYIKLTFESFFKKINFLVFLEKKMDLRQQKNIVQPKMWPPKSWRPKMWRLKSNNQKCVDRKITTKNVKTKSCGNQNLWQPKCVVIKTCGD